MRQSVSLESFEPAASSSQRRKSVQEIAGKDDPLSVPAGEALTREIDTPGHGVTHFGAEASSTRRRLAREKLTVDPGSALHRHLRFHRKIRPLRQR